VRGFAVSGVRNTAQKPDSGGIRAHRPGRRGVPGARSRAADV